jgi:hypothetical protein
MAPPQREAMEEMPPPPLRLARRMVSQPLPVPEVRKKTLPHPISLGLLSDKTMVCPPPVGMAPPQMEAREEMAPLPPPPPAVKMPPPPTLAKRIVPPVVDRLKCIQHTEPPLESEVQNVEVSPLRKSARSMARQPPPVTEVEVEPLQKSARSMAPQPPPVPEVEVKPLLKSARSMAPQPLPVPEVRKKTLSHPISLGLLSDKTMVCPPPVGMAPPPQREAMMIIGSSRKRNKHVMYTFNYQLYIVYDILFCRRQFSSILLSRCI